MTIQMLAGWNGLEDDAVVTLASPAEEARLISLGLARDYTPGMDGRNPVLSNAEQAGVQALVSAPWNQQPVSFDAALARVCVFGQFSDGAYLCTSQTV